MAGRVTMKFRVASNPRTANVVFQAFTGIDNTPGDWAGTATKVRQAYAAPGSLHTRFPNTVQLVEVSLDWDTGQDIDTTTVVGTRANTTLSPPQVCYLVRKEGGLRKRQGRMFLPGVAQADVDPLGAIPAANHAPLQAALDVFLTELNSRAVQMVQRWVLERDGTVREPVTKLSLQPKVATQRRRLRA